MVLCAMPLMLSGLGWIVLAKSLPWALARTFGTPFEERHLMHAYYRSARRACRYRLRGGPLEHAFPGYLCIAEDFNCRHPGQDVAVLLFGRRSVLGTSVQEIHSTR
ncbi:MAG TPA: hypothetical protein DDZ67_12155 [Xanthomonadaceae bacterium]|nr:hypothetical protein [Xanthomonadaceae bacterium]